MFTEFTASSARRVPTRALAAVAARRVDAARGRVARVAVRVTVALVLILTVGAERV